MPSAEQIQQQIEALQKKLHEANIREGKVNIAQEVKKRILESVPGIAPQQLEYILWPIRVANGTPAKSTPRSHEKVVVWEDPELERRLVAGEHEALVAEFGMTWASLRSHANHAGYAFRKNKPLKKKKEVA